MKTLAPILQAVTTETLTLADVVQNDYQFIIPSYQRPYVWSDDNVVQLFDDIKLACLAKEPYYFIGTTLSSKEQNYYELIDGQQRITTLMLIAIAFKSLEINTPLAVVASAGKTPRLQFVIRDQVQALLGSIAGLEGYEKPSDESIEKNAYLKQVNIALNVLTKEIRKVKEESESQAEALAEFIYNKVQWVNNIVPEAMDLNRLFATMNTAGVQLEQVDILKAKLFKQIKIDKAQYDAMWLACEQMDNYFERNVRQCFKKADWNILEYKDLAVFDKTKFIRTQQDQEQQGLNKTAHGLSIADIATDIEKLTRKNENATNTSGEEDLFKENEEVTYCRSIISFPLLLVHAYRIYKATKGEVDIEPTLQSDKLLDIFKTLIDADEGTIKSFIELLWQVRYQFDTWIVKWVERDDSTEEQLGLTGVSKSKNKGKYYLNRYPKELNALTMLQSVRYFTGDKKAHYWLTAFLGSLRHKKVGEKNDKKALELLETIDNEQSLTTNTLKVTSFKQVLMSESELEDWSETEAYLKESKGTNFEHYWFQKLEYLLWKDLKNKSLPSEADKKFKSYRITSKNSVEHVHPQHEEYGKPLANDYLHAFGNLVLLSPGENSSYSNQTVEKKQADFNTKTRYDSLKLRDIFVRVSKGKWDEGAIKDHQDHMISMLSKHYK